MKRLLYPSVAVAVGMMAFAVINFQPVSATHVTIDTNLSVSPSVISFTTVFPGEVHYKPLTINLSQDFLRSSNRDDVEYTISQRTKPRLDKTSERDYCSNHPSDLHRCYPSLCPYLSKEPDSAPSNDTGVPAFHDPSAATSIAHGRLAKSEEDTSDQWTIDLHTPCFQGQCDQTKSVPPEFQLDPTLHGQVFGCDLVVEVTSVSYFHTPTRTIGFWQTHTDFTSNIFQNKLGGSTIVGNGGHVRSVTNWSGSHNSILFGAFYSGISKKTDHNDRAAIDKARMRLLQQLMGAKLNCAAFTCLPATQSLINSADLAYATGTAAQMDALKNQLDAYNNSGDAISIPASLGPTGSATPSASQNRANRLFWDNP